MTTLTTRYADHGIEYRLNDELVACAVYVSHGTYRLDVEAKFVRHNVFGSTIWNGLEAAEFAVLAIASNMKNNRE